jgi:SAM-dependent methyltransferase
MENVEACPICKSKERSHYLDCKDYTVSRETFSIVSCSACGFKYTNPRPADEELGAYYQSEDYVSHSNTSKGLINFLYQKVRKHTINQKLKQINSICKKGTLLDVGCGTGEFLNCCKGDGWQVQGIEPSQMAREFATSTYSLLVEGEDAIASIADHAFDVITLWHVLEHVPHLEQRVIDLKRLLKPEGVLLIAVPNHTSKDAQHYKQFWAAYDLPRHLYHFAPSDISLLFSNHGFKPGAILPMKWDPFYVSLLSEKYKTGKPRLISAFWQGIKSNLSAARRNNTYSSQIYILRK